MKYETLKGNDAKEYSVNLIKTIAIEYNLKELEQEMDKDDSKLFSTDVFKCISGIVDSVIFKGDTEEDKLEKLKEAKNLYNAPIFIITQDKWNIKKLPDFEKVVRAMAFYNECFDMSIYHIANTILTLIVTQVTDDNLKDLCYKGIDHIARFIEYSYFTNENWDRKNETVDNPCLIIPIGAAGCGKSTLYAELANVINISCDNVRYLLFGNYGPSFTSWESTISWWVVNHLTNYYLKHGYNVFYNGVNTDLEYRSPMTMEHPDNIFKGLDYNIKLVYFEPPANLSDEELKQLKDIDLWQNDIDSINFADYSENVQKVLTLIKENYGRTVERTKKISSGETSQDPYDVLYCVPPAIIKLFVEQSFDKPTKGTVVEVPRKIIPDENERKEFYKGFAEKILNN